MKKNNRTKVWIYIIRPLLSVQLSFFFTKSKFTLIIYYICVFKFFKSYDTRTLLLRVENTRGCVYIFLVRKTIGFESNWFSLRLKLI